MNRTDLVIRSRGPARFMGRNFPRVLGRGGIVAQKHEGDGGIPSGDWRIEFAWLRYDRLHKPRTTLPLRRITGALVWSDDPRDPNYNQPVPAGHRLSHEKLRRGDRLYDLVLVLDINRHPALPGRGSALFIHRWRRPHYPTAGCIGLSPTHLLWLVRHWTRRSRVIIRP